MRRSKNSLAKQPLEQRFVVMTRLPFEKPLLCLKHHLSIENQNLSFSFFLNDALMSCAKAGQAEFVTVLIENGADPNTGDFVGWVFTAHHSSGRS
jgi:hypothetical protein